MTLQTLILIMAMVVVVMAWWANASKRDKIYCTFRRPDKSKLSKFVKMVSRYVVFDGRRYDVVGSCITYEWWTKGLVHMLFPQRVATLDYIYKSRWPIDPDTGNPVIISPEVRQLLNKEEWAKGFAKTSAPTTTKRQSFIQQYLPWVAILLVGLLGVYVVTNNQAIKQSMVEIINQINAIAR